MDRWIEGQIQAQIDLSKAVSQRYFSHIAHISHSEITTFCYRILRVAGRFLCCWIQTRKVVAWHNKGNQISWNESHPFRRTKLSPKIHQLLTGYAKFWLRKNGKDGNLGLHAELANAGVVHFVSKKKLCVFSRTHGTNNKTWGTAVLGFIPFLGNFLRLQMCPAIQIATDGT